MVALSMTRVLTGFALVGAAWATASPPAADEAAAGALNADDECAAAAGGAGCAVNAMQMRALKKEEAPAVQPLYCAMLPAGISSPFCSPGVTTCGCQAYCAAASPTSYGWDPNCCSCAGSPSLTPAVALNQVRAIMQEGNQPIYCQHLPAGVTSPYCTPGVNTCKCQGYCATASPTSFGWDPNCCSCTGITAAPPPAVHAAGGSCAAYGCTGAYTAAHTCQCNSQCAAHNDCCGDYTSKCGR